MREQLERGLQREEETDATDDTVDVAEGVIEVDLAQRVFEWFQQKEVSKECNT